MNTKEYELVQYKIILIYREYLNTEHIHYTEKEHSHDTISSDSRWPPSCSIPAQKVNSRAVRSPINVYLSIT
jgi:hypothetical protein